MLPSLSNLLEQFSDCLHILTVDFTLNFLFYSVLQRNWNIISLPHCMLCKYGCMFLGLKLITVYIERKNWMLGWWLIFKKFLLIILKLDSCVSVNQLKKLVNENVTSFEKISFMGFFSDLSGIPIISELGTTESKLQFIFKK